MERKNYPNPHGYQLVTRQDLAEAIAPLVTKQELQVVKHDLQMEIRSLEVKMEKGFADNLKWTVTAMIAISSVVIAIVKLL